MAKVSPSSHSYRRWFTYNSRARHWSTKNVFGEWTIRSDQLCSSLLSKLSFRFPVNIKFIQLKFGLNFYHFSEAKHQLNFCKQVWFLISSFWFVEFSANSNLNFYERLVKVSAVRLISKCQRTNKRSLLQTLNNPRKGLNDFLRFQIPKYFDYTPTLFNTLLISWFRFFLQSLN